MSGRINFWFWGMISLLSTMGQLLYGMMRMSRYAPPFVSIFGSARLKQSDSYAVQAHEVAQRLVDADVSVLTGGGAGIMEAANCGAIYSHKGKGRSIGIGVRDLDEEPNTCVQDFIQINQFWARKWLLTRYSSAFIIFPGGFGTLDELFEVLTLMQTRRTPKAPIVLVGTEYWKPFIEWCVQEAFKHGAVSKEEIDLFFVTDTIDEVFNHALNLCKAHKAE